MNFKRTLSEKVSELTGIVVTEANVFSDKGAPFFYYVRHLQPDWPVVLCHYRGQYILVLPEVDYDLLETGVKGVDEYVENSHWSFGRLWGGGSVLGGSYWRPLEDGTGIHEVGKISRYMTTLLCRTHFRASGYEPTPERCGGCIVNSTGCPCSPLNVTGDWTKEVQEPDGRLELFKALAERVKDELGFNVVRLYPHDGDMSDVYLTPVEYKPNTIELWINNRLLNSLLYAPNAKHSWEDIASAMSFVAVRRDWKNGQIVRQPISEDDPWPAGTCLEHWGKELLESWHSINRKAQCTSDPAPAWTEKMKTSDRFKVVPAQTFLQKVNNLFSTLFGKK